MIPIVETKLKMHLVGVITRRTLKRVLAYQQKLVSASVGSSTGIAEEEMIEMEKENAMLLEEMEKSSETYVPSPVGIGLLPPPMSPPSPEEAILEEGGAHGNLGDEGAAVVADTNALQGPLDLLEMSLRNPWVVIDPSPFHISENTPIRKILFMFSMLGGHVLFVTYRGKLVGTITKHSLVVRLSPAVAAH